LVIKALDPDPDPDPYWIRIRIGFQPKMLDPDEMNADPQPRLQVHDFSSNIFDKEFGVPLRI
jgi:hypothetical protein